MLKRIFIITLAAVTLFFVLPDFQAKHRQNNSHQGEDDPIKQQSIGITGPVNSPKPAVALTSVKSAEIKSAKATLNDQTHNDPNNTDLDKLLITDNLNDFVDTKLTKKLVSICRNKRHPSSDIACRIQQHWQELASKQDQADGTLQAIWLEAEAQGGISDESPVEITPLSAEKISEDAGGASDDQESVLQQLMDRAVHGKSPEIRRQALQEAINRQDTKLIPLLEQALNDEDQTNRELAADSLSDLQSIRELTGESADREKQIVDSGSPQNSLADISN